MYVFYFYRRKGRRLHDRIRDRILDRIREAPLAIREKASTLPWAKRISRWKPKDGVGSSTRDQAPRLPLGVRLPPRVVLEIVSEAAERKRQHHWRLCMKRVIRISSFDLVHSFNMKRQTICRDVKVRRRHLHTRGKCSIFRFMQTRLVMLNVGSHECQWFHFVWYVQGWVLCWAGRFTNTSRQYCTDTSRQYSTDTSVPAVSEVNLSICKLG